MKTQNKLNGSNIKSQYIEVLGSKIHYREAGTGDPILFLHGVPTSGYLWRNIIPYLSSLGKCIAPDLIGFGKSDKPAIHYSIHDHIKYIKAFIEKLNLKNILLVLHGWGSLIGFDYAMHNESNCKGLVVYEAHLRPNEGADESLPLQEQMRNFNPEEINISGSDGVGYVDRMLPQYIMRDFTEEAIREYREPFTQSGSEKPILQYLDEVNNINNKNEINSLIGQYSDWLSKCNLPKLLLYSIPGFLTTIGTVMWAKKSMKNIEIIEIGEELHLGQETHPKIIGETISAWLQALPVKGNI